jgi:mRNA-degrading endonuclease RelE of RelBE toxin-antitoxin system
VTTHWEIKITATATRELEQLPDGTYEELLGEILSLEEDPLPEGHIPLRGARDYYRIKAGRGRYRIIYRLLQRQRRILVVNVRPRGWAYSGYTKWRS